MSVHPVVGPLVSAHIIEESVIAKLRTWLPGYLTIACELNGVKEGIAAIKSWGIAGEDDKWPEQGLPALLLVGPGTTGTPETHSNGMYRASWSFEVDVVVAAPKAHKARAYAQTYGAAIRGALLQNRSQGESGQITEWLGEMPGIVSADQRRTVASSANAFSITRDEVVSWRLGPGEGKPPIPDEWPEVKETEIETEIE